MIDTPHITQSAAQRTAVIHLTVPLAEMQRVMGPGIEELFGAVAAQGIQVTGPWFTHHHRLPTDTFDFDICVPVSAAVQPSGRVRPGELRATQVARTVYTGGYEGLGAAWGELMGWIEREKLQPAADLWECYVAGPESGPDSSQYRTELNRPLLA
ncbi:MAG TPA: GyrI-like domain-containing protein [Rhizobacter sp.]|nr:GyrI-like domain-containing protein [Rhizobacter sp.]